MERGWWWKAALYGLVTVVAVLYLVPTLVPEEKQPSFIKAHFQKKIQLGLDLQGGLHLVYEVNVDKAVSDKVDRLSSDIEDRLHRDKGVTDVNVNREGRDDIILTFKTPAEQAKIDDQLLREYRKSLDLVERNAATGVVRLRLDPDQVEEVRDYACSGLQVGDGVEWSLRTPDWSLLLPIRTDPADPARRPQLYVKPDDRWEVNDVAQHHAELVEALERTLRAFVTATAEATFESPPLPQAEEASAQEPEA